MTDFDDHHVINQNLQGLINNALAGTGLTYNLDTRPVNRVYLPNDSSAATQLGSTYHQGPHGNAPSTSGYSAAVRQRVERLIADYGGNPNLLVQKLDEFAINIRAKLQTGQLSLFGLNDNVTRGRIADDATPTGGQAELDARQRIAGTFLGPNAPTKRSGLTRLAGYADEQLVKMAELFPEFMRKNGLAALADAMERAPALVQRVTDAIGVNAANLARTRAGRAFLRVLDKLGFVGDLLAIGLVYVAAEDLYQRSLDTNLPQEQRDQLLVASNREWVGFTGDLLGGLAGAAAGLVGGPFAPALSFAFSTGGAVAVRGAVEYLYDHNGDFRDFLGRIIQNVRESVAGLAPEAAERVQAQIPNAIRDILVQGEASYTFRDENGQPLLTPNGEYVLRFEYDAETNTLEIDRPGTSNDRTVLGIDLEEAGQELQEILIEQEMRNAPIAQGDVENPSVLASVDLPNGAHFQNVSFTLNGQSATYKIFKATAPDTSDDHTIVVTAALYSADGRTWYYGSEHQGTPGENWTISVLTLSHPNGNVTVDRSARVQPQASNDSEPGPTEQPSVAIPFAQIGAIFGSNLARLIPADDLWESTLAGSLLGTLGLNIGQAIERAELLKDLPEAARDLYPSAFSNLPQEFVNNLVNAGAGVVSSILVADLIDSIGVDGTLYGDWLQTEWSAQLAAVITNLPGIIAGTKTVADALGSVNPVNLLGGFLGSQLAAELVEFETVGGQIGAAIGSALGTLYGAELLGKIGFAVWGPLGAAIGAFIGYILGGLIGSLFGGKPKSGAGIGWNETEQEFRVANVWSKNGGSKDAARAMASSVAELLNGVIAAAGSRVIDAAGVQVGAYDTKGKDFIYKTSASANYAWRTRDIEQVITHGQYIALSDLSTRLMGGDVFVKRAVVSTLAQAGGNPDLDTAFSAGAFDVNTLLGNISTAEDYGRYLDSAAVVQALIASDPEGGFAGTWLVTLARVTELGLDRRWKSDWLGGWGAFLDETADGKIDGGAFSPANVFLELDPDTNERLFIFADADGAWLGSLGDTIDTASKDVILGTAATDALTVNGAAIALTAAHTLNGVAATAGTHTIRVAALIDGAGGDDVIRGGDLGNDLLGGAGADKLVGGKLDDWLIGGDGDDRLFAGAASNITFTLGDATAENAALALDGGNGDYLEGGAGDDALYGARGSDWLNGGDGVDRLLGGAGGDILQGGKGDERGAAGEARILGGAGSDQYIFSFGDGVDVIFDESDPAGSVGGADTFATRMASLLAGGAKNWAGNGLYLQNGDVLGGEDAISFGAGIGIGNLVMKRSGTAGAPGADLIIALQFDVNGVMTLTGDEITIKDWFNISRRVEWLRFANGEEIRVGDMTSFIAGTTGPDVIIGTFGSDFIVGGEGDDVIRGLAGDDYGFGGGGEDFVAGDGDNDMVSGGAGGDEVIGGAGNDTVFGDGGNDELYGGAGTDILAGGRGDDQIVTGADSDIVRYQRGDGRDVVLDEFVNNWDVVWQNETYLNGYVLQTNGTVTLGALVVFDGSKWIGQYDWNDTTKVLRRHKGALSGQVAANAGADSLEFGVGIDIQDLILRRTGNDVEIAIGSGDLDARTFDQIADRVTIKDWYLAASAKSIESLVFTEIGAFNAADYTLTGGTDLADTLAGTTSADWITGGAGDDAVTANSGNDAIAGGQGLDVLRGQAGDDIIYGGGGDDVLEGGAGVDQLIGGAGIDIASYAASAAVTANLAARTAANADGAGDVYVGIEGLEGSANADKLTGDGGDNILRGLAGADTLTGGAGDDSYEFEVGAGADIIRDGLFVSEQVLDAAGGFNNADFTAVWTLLSTTTSSGNTTRNYRLVVTRNGTGEQVYVSRDNVDFVYVNQVQAAAPIGTAWPFANSQWKGGFARTGNGVQTTRDLIVAGEGGADTIQLGIGLSLSDMTITRTDAGADLTIAFGGSDSIVIQSQNDVQRRVETVTLADGLAADLTALKLVGEAATANGDLMLGNASANTIDGLAGDDVIAGQAGNDILRGSAGDDALEGGAGGDTLDGGTDTQTDGAAAAPGSGWGDTIRYVRSTTAVSIDLAARTASGGDAASDIIVADAGGVSTIEHVVGSNAGGDTLLGDGRGNRLFGLGGNDIMDGRAGADVLAGGAGNDTLTGGDGEDNLTGELGDDTMHGGLGKDLLSGGDGVDAMNGNEDDDTLVGGAGADVLHGNDGADQIGGDEDNDQIYGDAGDDKLAGGAGADIIYGGAGADTLAGDSGNDTLRGELGDDVYGFDAASGADTIIDADGTNTIAINGIASSLLWLTRVGADLKITAIGIAESTFSILVSGYYAATTPTRVREIATADASIFLAYAEPLIDAMSAAGAVAPATMPSAIAATLASYWHAGGKAAPSVANVSASTNEDAVLTGAVAAIDHDTNITAYALDAPPAHGGVVVNALTGAWTYTPTANYFGADNFSVRVTDADGQSAVQQVAVAIASLNDAPHDITLTGAPSGITERDRPASGAVLNAIILGTLSGADVDAPDTGDFDDLTFTVADARFEIASGNVLQLKAGAALDFEAGASVNVAVTVTDRNGAGLAFTKNFTFAVLNADDYLYGAAANETLTGQAGRNIIFGLGGADIINGAGANDALDGGDGADVVSGFGGDDSILGGLGNDTLDGGAGADVLNAGDGDDTALGGDGADQLLGDLGNDTLDGGLGADTLQGGDHVDVLTGGAGDDRLEGGAGDDVMAGGAGADRFLGGAGVDTITYAGAASAVSVNLATSSGALGDAAGDVFEDIVEKLIGSGFGDTLTGSAGADVIEGGAGNDILNGGLGNDELYGGDGNDTLNAEAGNDKLNGGAGADILIGGDDSDTYLIDVNSGADEIQNYDPNGTDIDVLGYQDIDRSRLWFERVGNNLVISVIGTSTATTIKDWYVLATASDRANYKIDFFLAGLNFTKTINAEGLVALMAGQAKPADMNAYNALHANLAFENAWKNYWDANGAPVIAAIANQTLNEDGSLTLTINVTDDITPASGVTIYASAVQPGNPSLPDTSIVNTVSVGAADASGNRTLTVTTLANRSGATAIKIQAVDPGGVMSERVFQLSVAPIADAPTITQAVAASPIVPLTKPTLDSGSWAINLAAALTDQDGSETLELRVAGVPVGLSFNQGTSLGAGVWSFTPAQLAGLLLLGPATWSADLALTVTAIARETATGATATSAPVSLPIVINARPTDVSGAFSVNENAANGTVVGSAAGVDADAGESFSYALVDNAGGRFAINASSGQITVANSALLNYEAAASHAINVRVTDSGGLTRDKAFTVALNNVNEAPTALAFANVVSSLAENTSTAARTRVADFSYLDDALGAENVTLSGADAASFEIVGSSLYLRAGVALNYEAKASYSVTLNIEDPSVGANPDLWQTFTLSIADVNETPVIGSQSFSVLENAPGAGQTPVGTVAWSDPDTQSSNRDPRFAITDASGAALATTPFSINATTGEIRLQGVLDYETMGVNKFYDFYVQIRDQAGSGISALAPVRVNVTDANDPPVITAAKSSNSLGNTLRINATDIESDAISLNIVGGNVTETDLSTGEQTNSPVTPAAIPVGYTFYTLWQQWVGGEPTGYRLIGYWDVRATDARGATALYRVNFSGTTSRLAPIVLDLDGDGLELLSVFASGVQFDMTATGEPVRTGWVGADDALLVIDRNGNGTIDDGSEIAFNNNVDFAVSDLEGLRAYDSNENGAIDAGDAGFSSFQVWQDLNQDGVSQTGELTSLAQRDIASIGLTLSPNMQGQIGEFDNILYGTASFTHGDGSVGTVGDVMLAFLEGSVDVVDAGDIPAPSSGQLAPIVLDLDGNGVSLITRDQSSIRFDANGDRTSEKTGWFSAGDGVLAFDRNFNGTIDSGLEISFLGDVQGAVSDLEGLGAFDSNQNGAFDKGDTWFGAFNIWQDRNQDGMSQKNELGSLADHGIVSINLTRSNVQPNSGNLTQNAIIASSTFTRSDGSVGAVGDVMLAYGENAPTSGGDEDRTADSPSTGRGGRGAGGGGGGGGGHSDRDEQAATDASDEARRRRGRDGERNGPPQRVREEAPAFANVVANDLEEPRLAAIGAQPSALHARLGVMDRKLLGMIDAMAQFEASSAADTGLARKKLDPRVAELLTSLPDLR